MLSNVLPESINNVLNKLPYSSLCELRLRADSPVVVNLQGEKFYLSHDSIIKESNDALKPSMSTLQGIMQRLAKFSFYSINDQVIEGYITYDGGIRVGVCGEVVMVDNKIKTIKNVSSVNFRFPHVIKNCSLKLWRYIVDSNNDIKSTLIISPPGAGKTTYLRDLIFQLSTRIDMINILVIDERQELVNVYDGSKISSLKNIDYYSNCTKKFAFNNGIRSMSPNVIVTDEINIERDVDDIENALTSGIKVFASIHASDINDLQMKNGFKSLLSKQLFDRYVVLSNNDGIGTVEGVYNNNFKLIGV